MPGTGEYMMQNVSERWAGPAAETPARQDSTDNAAHLLEDLADATRPLPERIFRKLTHQRLTPVDLAKSLGISEATVMKTCRQMFNDGTLTQRGGLWVVPE